MTAVIGRTKPRAHELMVPKLGRGATMGALTFLVASAGAATLIGADSLPADMVMRVLVEHLPLLHARHIAPSDAAIVWQIRLPRVVLAGLVGAMLALAGAAYQGVFANPLADPYLLGAASGAELGATLAIAYAPAAWALNAVPACAFAGAAGAVVAAVLLGRSVGGNRPTTALVLAGVAVGAFLSAVETYVQQQHQAAIRLIYSYVLGRLGTAGWAGVRLVLPYLAVSSAVILLHRRHLDVLSLGDVEAASLGVNVGRTRMLLVAAATLGTAAAVAMAGTIAFVGIVVPHTIRLLTGGSYRTILPLSMITGAGFLILCDLAARTLIAPGELPIGVITAFVGAPFFVVLLRRSHRVTT
jgi:iron complex transport system permease protein